MWNFSPAGFLAFWDFVYGKKKQVGLNFLQGCGVVVASEVHTNKGRADLVVSYKGNFWVIELKVARDGENAEQKAEEAYRQIIDNNYATPYPNAVCLGLCIDDSIRQITASKMHSVI